MTALAAFAIFGLAWAVNAVAGWVVISDDALGRLADVAGVLGLLVGFVSAVWPLVDVPSAGSASSPAGVADDLADKVAAQWQDEERTLALRQSGILPLSWSSATAIGSDGTAVRVRPGRLDGNLDKAVDHLADSFRALPDGRLLVLGEPGSGKTVLAMLLTLGLLKHRQPGERVAMLLSLSSWDPTSQALHDWMIDKVADANYGGNRAIARMLLSAGRLLPVLDGLDELPEPVRRIAVSAINRATQGAAPVVLTCRLAEFIDVVSGGGPALRRAAVVQVDPLAVDDVVTYLTGADPAELRRWRRVLDEIDEHRAGPLAMTFASPLMVSVAKAAYRSGPRDPDELLTLDSRHDLENHLVDCLVDVAYPSASPEADPARGQRWLTFLAAHLHKYRQRDIAWWRLGSTVSSEATVVVALAAGLLTAGMWFAWHGLRAPESLLRLDTATDALTVGLLSAVLYALALSPKGWLPGRLSLRFRGSLPRVREEFLQGATPVCALTVMCALMYPLPMVLSGNSWTIADMEAYLVAIGALLGLTLLAGAGTAVHGWLSSPREDARRADPVAVLRDDRLSTFVGCLAAGVVVGSALIAVLRTGVVLGAVAGSGIIGSDVGSVSSATYLSGFRTDEWPVGLLARINDKPVAASIVAGLAFTGFSMLRRAWTRFTIARALLSVRRKLPLSLLTFLEEANDRGLLRRVGGVYQFRHLRIQERLITRASPDRTGAEPHADRALRRKRALIMATAITAVAPVAILGVMVPKDGAVKVLHADGMQVQDVRFLSPGFTVMAAGFGRRRLMLWNATRAEPFVSVDGLNELDTIAIAPDGRTMAVGSQRGVAILRTGTDEAITTVAGAAAYSDTVFSPDGLRVLTDRDYGTVQLSDARTGRGVTQVSGLRGVTTAAFSPDGRFFTVSTEQDERLLVVANAPDARPVPLRVNDDPIESIAFSPQSTVIAASAGDQTMLWTPATGDHTATVDDAGAVSFSPDGKYLAISGTIGLHLYDASTGKLVRFIEGDYSTLLWGPDNDAVALIGYGGQPVRLWSLSAETLIADLDTNADGLPVRPGRCAAGMLVGDRDQRLGNRDRPAHRPSGGARRANPGCSFQPGRAQLGQRCQRQYRPRLAGTQTCSVAGCQGDVEPRALTRAITVPTVRTTPTMPSTRPMIAGPTL